MNDPLPTTANDRRRGTALAIFAALALALLAVGLRLSKAWHHPLDPDEIYFVFLARLGWTGMMRVVTEDVEQPLYYAMSFGWRLLGGESDLWVRTLAILGGVAGVLAVVPLGRRLVDARTGWLAAFLLALHRTHVLESQNARPNAWLWLFITLAVIGGWGWLDERRPRQALLFVASGAAALYTYYFGMFPLAVLVIAGAIRLRGDRRALAQWLGLSALVALAFAPLAPTWWEQLLRDAKGDADLPPMPVRDILTLARHLLERGTAPAVALCVPMLAALAPREKRGSILTLWALVVVPIVVPFALSQSGWHLFFLGQMQLALPFVCLLFAAGVRVLSAPAARRAATAALVLLIAWPGLRDARPARPDEFITSVGRLRARVHPGDLLVATEPHAMLYQQFHLAMPLRYRLLVMPGVEPFHYSDAVLAVPDSLRMSPEQFRAAIADGGAWWGVRFVHFPEYRTGQAAATMLDSVAHGPLEHGRFVTLWDGRAADAAAR